MTSDSSRNTQPEDSFGRSLFHPASLNHAIPLTAIAELQQLHVPEDMADRIKERIHQHIQLHPTPVVTVFVARRQILRGSIAAASLLIGLSLVWVLAGQSLPGQPLYGMKEWQNTIQLQLAGSPNEKYTIQAHQLHAALHDLQTVTDQRQDPNSIQTALTTVVRMTTQLQQLANTQSPAQQTSYAAALANERSLLLSLLQRVNWPERLLFSQQLSALSVPIPRIQFVDIQPDSKGIQITISGSNFSEHAQIALSGVLQTPDSVQISASQITAYIPVQNPLQSPVAVGVQNQDGTNAQINAAFSDENYSSANSSSHHNNGSENETNPTPTSHPKATATPEPTPASQNKKKPTPTPAPTPIPAATSATDSSNSSKGNGTNGAAHHSHGNKPPHE